MRLKEEPMSYSAGAAAAGTAAAAHAAAIARAIKASGTIVRVEPAEFLKVLARTEEPLVVFAERSGFLNPKKYEYLTSYKGLAFFTKSSTPVQFAGRVEIISAKKIWIP
jgi:hypothetical protein